MTDSTTRSERWTRRAYGLHSPEAALALVMLTCGPMTLTLPNHTAPHPHS